jgi:Na+-transporting NADH:ubiquinone oxidoreductase subunit NqrB
MRVMIQLSLLLNIAVLTPVCAGLISNASWVRASYGEATQARGILLSVYLAIGIVSALLLFVREPKFVAALLLVQIVYKLTTPLTVGTFANPVVMSNLGIAAFHSVTLAWIWRASGQ